MTRARLVVQLPDDPWVADVSRTHTEATFRVLAVIPGDGPGYAIVRISAPTVDPVLQDARDHPAMTDLTVLSRAPDEATIQFETSTPLLVRAARDAGVPLRMPVEIENGEATLTVDGSRSRLPELAARFEERGISYRIERITEGVEPNEPLTDRQREVVVAAVEHGYYDTPRRCSLTELADRLGVAKSTLSETLHRAEGAIVTSFFDGEQ